VLGNTNDAITAIQQALESPTVQEPEIVQRVKRYAGQTMRTARNPNITARECIELANWIVTTQPAAQPAQQEPINVAQAYAMAQVCLDLHDAIGCKWGDNPYLAIDRLKTAAQPAPVQEPVAWTVSGKITDWSKDFSAYQTKHYTRPVYTPPAAPAQPVAWYEWTGAIKPTKSLDSDRPLVFGDTPPAAQPAPVQDSTCNETLRAQGKAYPRTCRKCGFGPCIGAKLKEKNNG
jgi:hypothetical protein